MRHGSLQINIIYKITKLESWGYDSKLEILIKKIKVKNQNLYLYFPENHILSVVILRD